MKESDRLTVWDAPEALIDSQYGLIPFLEWLAREAIRIAPRTMSVIEESTDGFVALFREDEGR